MALILPNSVFLHIPKTGGIWIRRAIARSGIQTFEYGEQHTHFPELLQFADESFFRKKIAFTFIRHPVTWYQSRWAFRVKNGWAMKHPLDFNCASNDFCTFVENCLKYKPSGWVTWLCKTYIDPLGMVTEIGRQESLISDLIRILDKAGETYNKKDLKTTKLANTSDMDGYGSSYWAAYTPELLDKVLTAEKYVIDKYYQDYPINPNILCHPRSY